tara:strand:+ start:748 stop:948 length:201 start_codon:yes stop_codon:yes gene_type:complete
MSDGYITSKQLSGNEGLTGVARTEAEQDDRDYDDAIREVAMELIQKEREKKESNIKKEKRKKSAAK